MSAELLTDLIHQAQTGDAAALRGVFDATYQDLRSMARKRLRANSRGTLLDTTSLVHESFLRFANAGQLRIEDRQHFLRYASQVMRSVVVDYVRERMAERRGGDASHVTLNTQLGNRDADGAEEILRVHEALEELAKLDPRIAQVVEMRYFAGMTETEIAEALGITDRTVRRDWEKARLLLAEALK
jgi:RNA polymerase sigma factor (TIGR02999 family)